MEFSEKTVIVTGGSRGIGRAICEKFAENGANIVLNYSSSDAAAQEVKAKIEESGAKCILVKGSVAEKETADNCIKAALDNFGSVDVLVNNAGITRDGLAMKMKDEDFDDVIAVNLKGAFNFIRAAARPMAKQKGGSIVNLSSVSGVAGNAGQINYSASKAGVIGMTKTIAKELAGKNVTCNAVAPGFITTDMTGVLSDTVKEKIGNEIPLKRFGTPEEVADLVLFLSSVHAKYITGQIISIDGGMIM